ncbi:MAG: sulfotransferase family protein [Anaerolineales bacterium]
MAQPFLTRLKRAGRILLQGDHSTGKRDPIPGISPEEIQEARQFFPRDKFFIFGHARSGTTLLARLVRVHPEVHCNYQAHFFTRAPLLQSLVDRPEIESWLARRSNRWNHGRDLSPVILRAAADFILEREALQAGKNIVGDKSPNSLLDGGAVELMHKVYPDARLIFIVRDGRDTAVSHRFQAFIDSPQHLNTEDLRLRSAFAEDPQPFKNGSRSVFTEKGIRTAAESWVHNLVDTDRAGRERYPQSYLSLRYEDLLRSPLAEMQRVWSFLGASPDLPELAAAVDQEMDSNPDADWQQEKANELVSPLEKGTHGSWRELFTARDRSIFKQVAGQTLIDWGYEKDLEW